MMPRNSGTPRQEKENRKCRIHYVLHLIGAFAFGVICGRHSLECSEQYSRARLKASIVDTTTHSALRPTSSVRETIKSENDDSHFGTKSQEPPLIGKSIQKNKNSTAIRPRTIPIDNGTGSVSHPGFKSVLVYSNAMVTRKPPTKDSYSQAKQDLVIMALMDENDAKSEKNHSERFFVDLAANDAITLSNTFFLEQNGWRGLCIEPNPRYWYGLASYRKCDIVGAFVGGEQKDDGKEIDVVLRGVYGGIVGKGMDNDPKKPKVMAQNKEKRNIVSIKSVFEQTNTPQLIDFLSLDVEGAETLVMQNFPWQHYTFQFMTIERPKNDLKALLAANGYTHVYDLTSWGETLWMHESVSLTKNEIEKIIKDRDLQCFDCGS